VFASACLSQTTHTALTNLLSQTTPPTLLSHAHALTHSTPTQKTAIRSAYADSKTLSEAQREALFAAVRADDQLAHAADVISAATISAKMLGR
jgi:hypothetical protein